jgi:hypothetical protein
MRRKDIDYKATDFYDQQDPRGMSTSEYDDWMSAKKQQKQHLVDMMQGDEQLGLYDDNQQHTTNIFVEGFLLRNNFDKRRANVYANGKCIIEVLDHYYQIEFTDHEIGEVAMYTDNWSIPQLVGILTWHDLIDKNYKK